MKYPNVKVVFDRRRTAGPCRGGYVEVEVCYDRKRKYLSTGVSVLARHWNGTCVVGVADAGVLNARIEAVRGPVMRYVTELMMSGGEFSMEGLMEVVGGGRRRGGGGGGDGSFVDYVRRRIGERTDIRESTRRSHGKLLGWLQRFGRIERFGDLTRGNIVAFDDWLHAQGYRQWTVRDAHKLMKVYINDAVRHDVFGGDPYRGVKVAIPREVERRFLRAEELDALRGVVLGCERLERVRDVFLFQCNTGLAYADLARFDFGRVQVQGGRYVLRERRQKSGELFVIVLLPEAMGVLERYGYRLPLPSIQKYNDYLKVVALRAGLDVELTSHMARHTFAVMCLNNGVRVETLARMMGHADIKTTQVYARILGETVVEAFDCLAESLGQRFE